MKKKKKFKGEIQKEREKKEANKKTENISKITLLPMKAVWGLQSPA